MSDTSNDGLTDKQRAFVAEYLVDLNATQAAIRAGYSEKTARATGAENLTKPDIQTAIEMAHKARAARTQITQDAVLVGLSRIAFGDLRRLFDAEGSLKPIHEVDDDTAAMLAGIDVDTAIAGSRDDQPAITIRTSKIKRADQLRALELLGKHLGMFKEQLQFAGKVAFVVEK